MELGRGKTCSQIVISAKGKVLTKYQKKFEERLFCVLLFCAFLRSESRKAELVTHEFP